MRFPTAFLFVAAIGVLGCGRIREVKGCRALARLVNPVLDDISERVAHGKGADPYRYAAERYGKLASDLKKFDVGIPRAEKSIDDLGTALREASTQSAKLAEALEKRDVVVAASARRDLGHVARLEKAIVTRIDNDCGG